MIIQTTLVLVCSASLAFGQFGTNLIENPSFEGFVPNETGTAQVQGTGPDFTPFGADLLSWDVILGTLTLDRYDGPYAPTTGTPADAGDYYLFGDFTPLSVITQVVDLGFAQAEIDKDATRFELEALLGSYVGGTYPESQDDIAVVVVGFLDGTGAVLDEISITGPSVPGDVGLPDLDTGNFQFPIGRVGRIPSGARSVVLRIELVRDLDVVSGGFNNANVDRMSLVVEPRCVADLDADGLLSLDDVLEFVVAFSSDHQIADIDGSGTLDLADIIAFVEAFQSGCG